MFFSHVAVSSSAYIDLPWPIEKATPKPQLIVTFKFLSVEPHFRCLHIFVFTEFYFFKNNIEVKIWLVPGFLIPLCAPMNVENGGDRIPSPVNCTGKHPPQQPHWHQIRGEMEWGWGSPISEKWPWEGSEHSGNTESRRCDSQSPLSHC